MKLRNHSVLNFTIAMLIVTAAIMSVRAVMLWTKISMNSETIAVAEKISPPPTRKKRDILNAQLLNALILEGKLELSGASQDEVDKARLERFSLYPMYKTDTK